MSRKQAIVSPSLTAASVAVKLAAAWSGFGATAPKVLGVKGIFPLQAPYAPRNEVQWLAYGLLANLFFDMDNASSRRVLFISFTLA